MLASTVDLSQEQAISLHESNKSRKTHQTVIASAQSFNKILGFFCVGFFFLSFFFPSLLFFMEVFPEASAFTHCSAVAGFLTGALWITAVPFSLRLSDTAKKRESFQTLLHAALSLFFSSLMCFQLCMCGGVSSRLF